MPKKNGKESLRETVRRATKHSETVDGIYSIIAQLRKDSTTDSVVIKKKNVLKLK